MITCNIPHDLLNEWNAKMGNTSVVAVVMQDQETSFRSQNKDGFGIQCTYVTPSSWKSSSGGVRSL